MQNKQQCVFAMYVCTHWNDLTEQDLPTCIFDGHILTILDSRIANSEIKLIIAKVAMDRQMKY